jgi:hypothetical protein
MLSPNMAGNIYYSFRNAGGADNLVDWGEEDALAVTWAFAVGLPDPALCSRVLNTFRSPGFHASLSPPPSHCAALAVSRSRSGPPRSASATASGMSGDDKFKDVFPRSKAEAQRYINNGTIVFTKWMLKDSRPEAEQSLSNRRDFLVKDFIREVSVWDGESYRDGFFCNNDHAMEYAYTMVRSPEMKLHTVKYLAAMKAQAEKVLK